MPLSQPTRRCCQKIRSHCTNYRWRPPPRISWAIAHPVPGHIATEVGLTLSRVQPQVVSVILPTRQSEPQRPLRLLERQRETPKWQKYIRRTASQPVKDSAAVMYSTVTPPSVIMMAIGRLRLGFFASPPANWHHTSSYPRYPKKVAVDPATYYPCHSKFTQNERSP
jgi:hypothetical protein